MKLYFNPEWKQTFEDSGEDFLCVEFDGDLIIKVTYYIAMLDKSVELPGPLGDKAADKIAEAYWARKGA